MERGRSLEHTNGRRGNAASRIVNAELDKVGLGGKAWRMPGFRLMVFSLLLMVGGLLTPHPALADGWSWVSGTGAMVQSPEKNDGTWMNYYGLNMYVKPGQKNWVHISIPVILQSSPKASKINLELFTGSSDVNVTAVKLTSFATYYARDIAVTPFGCTDHQTYQFVELGLGGTYDFPFGVTLSLEITAGTDTSVSHRFCLAGVGVYWITSAATAVELSSFSAKPSQAGVNLRWETAQEPDNSGFHLLRSATKKGGYRRITNTIIPSEGSPFEGARYSYEDGEAARGKTWFYKLVDIDYSGKKTVHGPISTAGLVYTGEESRGKAPAANTFEDGDRRGPVSVKSTDIQPLPPPALP